MLPTIVFPDQVRAEAQSAQQTGAAGLREMRSDEGLAQSLRQSTGDALISLGNWVKPRTSGTSLRLGRPNWAGR